ncbi:MAG: flagellar filament capping protein FliD [Negativicutes bacterium]|nr:flagellar filament capping protein FliD [Negativicutes bacterium]
MSSSTISATTVNGTTRYTGLSSGIDVDTIVSELMTAEKAKKLDKLQEKEQLSEWKQDSYRSIITDIDAFESTYFDATSSSSLLSSTNLSQYSVTSSSAAVTATYTSDASAGSHTVSVSQLAAAATLESSASLAGDITGDSAPSYSALSGTGFDITLDGTEYTVDCSDVTDIDSLQSTIDDAVGADKLTVGTNSSGYLTISATYTDSNGDTVDSGVDDISISSPASGTSALSDLGLTSGTSNRLTTSSTLADISGLTFDSDNDSITLAINGVTIPSFDKSTTIAEMVSDINDADCGATAEYDETSGKLILTADSTGAGNTLTVSESDTGNENFLSNCLSVSTAGTDAKVTIDGTSYTRSANNLTVDGVAYTFNTVTTDSSSSSSSSDSAATVTVARDTDAVYDLISNFVSDYNALIATINDTIDEDYDSDYPPLTDDQKSSMTDTQITNYEEKAKTGLLENDSTLSSFLTELRDTMINSVSGLSTSVFDIGIDTSDSYTDNGKLTITESTLKSAIEDNPDAVIALFTQQASSVSGTTGTLTDLDSSERSTRYNEEGIAYRFYDVIEKYTSISSKAEGLLVSKAGVADTLYASDNSLSTQISKYETEITAEQDRLSTYEDRVYTEYSSLETYINKMNTQLSALESYLSSSSS